MRRKCIIWGMGKGYEEILNQIKFEIYKDNMEVIAVVCRPEDKYCRYRDGFPIISKEEMKGLGFEYVIVSSYLFYQEIREEAMKWGIDANKILNGQIFKIPLFDFSLYVELIENPVTILTDDCWGGFVYHYLGLVFSSPLINTLWGKSEYARFIQDPLFYLETELTMVREGDLRAGLFPIGKLGRDGKEVEIKFIHNVDFYEAKQQWDRRRKRINPDNLFVKMGFGMSDKAAKEYIEVFSECKYNKILFYNGDEEVEGKLCTDRFLWHEKKGSMVHYFQYEGYMRLFFHETIDLLKLLTGSENYSREWYPNWM